MRPVQWDCLKRLHTISREKRSESWRGTSVSLRGIRFLLVLILVRLLSSSFFASGNDGGWPPGMDLLFARRWRLVEVGHDHLAHGLLRGIWRIGLAVSGFIFLVVLLVGHLRTHSTILWPGTF